MSNILKKEDYAEPECPLCIENLKRGTNITAIPVSRVMDKLDEYYGKNDYDGAEKHLLYWKGEAEAGFDSRGKFSVLNELMGLYRKTGKREEAFAVIEEALKTVEELDIKNTVSAATAYLNAATVYKAFKEPEKSLRFFNKAASVYEKELKDSDERFGGLYNNYALTLVDLARFDEAKKLYDKAIAVMSNIENGELEMAITYLNIADLYEKQYGSEAAEAKINEMLDIAEKLLDTEGIPKNGYYAFVCEKCAPTFLYYGRFDFGNRLSKRAKEIYERP